MIAIITNIRCSNIFMGFLWFVQVGFFGQGLGWGLRARKFPRSIRKYRANTIFFKNLVKWDTFTPRPHSRLFQCWVYSINIDYRLIFLLELHFIYPQAKFYWPKKIYYIGNKSITRKLQPFRFALKWSFICVTFLAFYSIRSFA